MIVELIEKAQKGNQEAMMHLIDQFRPLIKKYGYKLGYEDADEDVTIYFVEIMYGIDMSRMHCVKDEIMVAYIHTSIVNFYNKNIKKAIRSKQELAFSELSEEQRYYVETLLTREDSCNSLEEMGLKSVLTQAEYQLIYAIYQEGYTVAEIARLQHKSRQSVNQHKRRILLKIKNYLKK